jgi:phosphatidylglycerophosphatase A
VGTFPIAPGTAGSAVGVLLDQALRATLSTMTHGVAILIVTVIGVKAATLVEDSSKQKDPSWVVVDELAGMLLSLYLLPLSGLGLFVGFLVFRLFDIVKPFPCRQAEKLHGGTGIMLDDLIAGLYTNLVLRLMIMFWPALVVSC